MRFPFRLPALLLCLAAACAEPAADGEAWRRPGSLEVVHGVTSGMVDFGNVTVGAERRRRVVFRNGGDRPLRIEAPVVGAPFASDAVAMELAGGQEVEIPFRVELGAEGVVTAAARVPWSGGAIDLVLRAKGVGCLASVGALVDFGTVPVGGRLRREALVQNVGEGTCTLTGAVVEGTGFAVEALPQVEILPGAQLGVPVVFAPAEGGPATGTLRIDLDGAVQEVELRGAGADGCFAITPAAVDLGVVPSCVASLIGFTVQVENSCDAAFTWREIEVQQEGGAFAFRWGPTPGTRLPAGGVANLELGAVVASPGVHEGVLSFRFDEAGPFEVPLRVEIDPAAGATPIAQTWWIDPVPPVDVLLVVDDTTAMASHADGFDAFAATLGSRLDGHEFQVGVTTVSSATAPGCPEAPGGRLVPLDGSGPQILTPGPGFVDALSARLQGLGTCQDPAVASGLESAWNVLQPGAAPGLLREDSWLMLLFLVASDDRSADPPETWSARFESLRPPDALAVETWLEAPSAMCDGGNSLAYELFTSLMDGRIRNICFAPWPAPAAPPFAPAPSSFYLTSWPADLNGDGELTEAGGELRVELDGERVPQYAEDGSEIWSFYSITNSVRFNEGYRPRPGQQLTIHHMVSVCDF